MKDHEDQMTIEERYEFEDSLFEKSNDTWNNTIACVSTGLSRCKVRFFSTSLFNFSVILIIFTITEMKATP